MKRRQFITLIGGAAAAWPIRVRAQQPVRPVIGFLDSGSRRANTSGVAGFRKGLREAGFIVGKDVTIEFRWANREPSRLPALAAELVARRVTVIVASGAVDTAFAAKKATSTIPIVIAGGADPVKSGLVASLNRPEGNITGVTAIHNSLGGKRLGLLLQLLPPATTVGYLTSKQTDMTQEDTAQVLAAGAALKREVIVLECRAPSDFDAAFATLVERAAGALLVAAFPLAFNHRGRILEMAAHLKIPAMYPQNDYVYGGGLMSYQAAGTYNQAAAFYVAQILKGAMPADLPLQQPTKFKFLINLKTAKTLGITVPRTLLIQADKVIE